jgi:hypothetical protein
VLCEGQNFKKISASPRASSSIVLKMKKLFNDGRDLMPRPKGGKKLYEWTEWRI